MRERWTDSRLQRRSARLSFGRLAAGSNAPAAERRARSFLCCHRRLGASERIASAANRFAAMGGAAAGLPLGAGIVLLHRVADKPVTVQMKPGRVVLQVLSDDHHHLRSPNIWHTGSRIGV